MSIYKGTTPLAGIVTPHLDTRNIGQIIKSYLPLTDAGLHLLDGALLSGDGAYAAFVTYIGQLVGSHPELFTTEADWQACVAAYGVCGKFVYTAAAGADPATVRLPKKASAKRYLIASSVSGTEWCDVYSDGWCEQGGVANRSSSNIVNLHTEMADTNYSVFICGFNQHAYGYTTTASRTTTQFSFNTADDNSDNNAGNFYWRINGYADVSNYESDVLYQYIVIANSTKTSIEVDIDEIATDLNGKADVDLSNVSGTSGFRKLVEVYNNSGSWYKIYDEYDPSTGTFIGKWCEQGGTVLNSATSLTVAFLKSYLTTDYYLGVYSRESSNDTGGYDSTPCEVCGNGTYDYGQAVDGFRCSTGSSSRKFTWFAKGYMATGD